MKRGTLLTSIIIALALSACAAPVEDAKLEPVKPVVPTDLITTPLEFNQLPGWAQDNHGAVIPAVRASCKKFNSLPASRSLGGRGNAGTYANWKQACYAAAYVDHDDHQKAKQFFEKWFKPHLVHGEGLFTGYFEASLNGSLAQTPKYRYPLYRRPSDLILVDLGEFKNTLKGQRTAGRISKGHLVPYEDRRKIRRGSLRGMGLELVWVDNQVDAFFLHIQGSGRVKLPDGSSFRVGYDGHNGHEYYAIGRELVKRGVLSRDEVSLQSIRRWLRDNPGEANDVMDLNKSYIFFRELPEGGGGPVGAQGVALTPGRSLAVDKRFVPLGVPLWLNTTDPLDPAKPLQRLVVAQDTGGAIKGVVRGDLFWGHGSEALVKAGVMKQQGRYYMLLPRAMNN